MAYSSVPYPMPGPVEFWRNAGNALVERLSGIRAGSPKLTEIDIIVNSGSNDLLQRSAGREAAHSAGGRGGEARPLDGLSPTLPSSLAAATSASPLP